MKTLYIIRGLPGTGKSTLARALATPAYTFEADQYFTINGVYTYQAHKIRDAHMYCYNCTYLALDKGIEIVAVANTFSRRWEFEKYLTAALQFNYRVVEITLTGPRFENTHNVPEETIALMKERWEV